MDSLVTLQEQKIEILIEQKMEFMLDNDLFSMEANSDVIISQINAYEMKLYDIETEINIQKNRLMYLNLSFRNKN